MALSLLAKAKQYFTSKSQDNEGWIRKGKFTPVKNLRDMAADSEGWFQQGKFTPARQISSQINYQKQNSPINRALYTGIETAGRPIANSLANIGALGTTALGSAQMAFNKPQAAQRSFNTALNLRNFAGTQGSFDQGTGWNTIKKGGIDAIQTALTGKGLKYVNPANLGISGLLSGGASKLSGGDFATGVGQGMGATPSIMGFVGMTNPILSKVLGGKLSPLVSGKVGSRLTPAIANVAQGVGLDLARGTPTTLTSMGLDLATGLAGGKGQFDMGTNFSMPRNTMDEVIQAEDKLLHPERYLENTISVTKKNANSIRNVQIKKIQEEAAKIIDQISAKYLPNEVLKTTSGNVKAQIKALVDLSGQNKLANVNYIYGGKEAQGYKPNMEGQFSNMADKKVRFEIDDSKAKLIKKPFKMDNALANKLQIPNGKWPQGKLSEFIDHPELFKKYPELKNIDVIINEPGYDVGARGYFDSGKNQLFIDHNQLYDYKGNINEQAEKNVKSIILHELEHSIQTKEGFAKGGNLESVSQLDPDTVNEITGVQSVLEDALKQKNSDKWVYNSTPVDKIIEITSDAPSNIKEWAINVAKGGDNSIQDFLKETPYNKYQRLSGEIEARDVSARMDLTPEQRARTMPYASQGIPQNEWITKFDDNTSLSKVSTPEVKGVIPEGKGITGFKKVNEYINPSGKVLMERYEVKLPDGSSNIIEKTNTGFHTFTNKNNVAISNENIPLSSKPFKTFEEAKASFDSPSIPSVKQPTIKIKPSEKIKIKPTLENQVASPQTSKLPKTQQQLETNPLNPVTKPESTLADSSSPYFNTKNLNIKDKSKTFVTKTIEEVKPEIEKVTGKKLTNKETVEFANNSAGVLNKVVTRTETLAWEAKMLKARELLAKQASEGKITQEYLDNLLAIKSQGSDIARKLQSLSMGADPKEATAKQAILEAILKVTDDTEALLKKAKGVDFNDYDQAASFYRQFVKPKASDWLEKVRYSSMLSSPNTHINNASSNFQGTGIIAPIEKTISGQVDWLLSAINPNRKRQQFAGEGAAYAKGYYSNIGNAWTKFTDTMTGKKLSSAQEMYSLPLTEKGTTGRKVENVLSVPGKLLQAADEFFQTLTEGGSTEALKYREGQGIKIRDIEGQAYLEGRKRLFNSGFGLKEEGYVLKALEFIPQKVAEARMSSNPVISTIAKYTFPFVRVPSNILKASVEYGPLGVTTLPGASNKVGQLSKAILGTSIGLAVAALVGEDRLTWAEPRDEKKRNAARAAGWQPYSLKIGNNYYSYSKMHPAIAFNLALVAAVRDSEKKKLLDDGQVETVLNGLAKWVNFYADMSYVKNIGDAVSGINGDLSAGTRQVSNYVQQLVPFRALMGWVARIVDPYQRQVDPKGEILDKQLQQLMTQIPGLSSQVPIRQDSSGNLVENPHRLINAFSPSRVTTEKTKLMGDYNRLEGLTQFNRQEAVIKQQVADTGQEQIYNGKKYYPSFETDSKTGEKKPIVKSIKVTQSMSEIYQGLDKEYQVSEDAPKNFIQKIGVYGTGIFKDPKGTLNAIKTGQPIRKVRGDAVVVERLKGLDTLDQGDQATQVDHIVAVSLGGTNDESNLQIISKQENQAKGVVDTYLANLLDKGLIKKVEAQERDLNWRNEISNLPISEKKKIETIMSKEPEPMKENVSETILTKLSSKEYEPIYNEDTKTYSNVTIKIPEYPKLTGQTELDKKLKSKYSSALTTARNNITKLYLDGQITAKEAEEALIALNNKKSSTGKSKSKGGKITIAKTPEPKVIKFKLPTIKLPTNTLKSNIKIKKPSIAQLKKRRTIKIKV